MPVVILRPGNLYGPYDDFEWATSHVLPALMRKVIERHDPIEVWGDGNDIKDFLYIDDFVEGMLLAMARSNSFDCFNLASGRPAAIREALQCMIEHDGYGKARLAFDSSKPSMIPKRLISIEKARHSLDFEPLISLRDGISRTMKWYRSQLCPASEHPGPVEEALP
jgi:GDP-L-fucose synthase